MARKRSEIIGRPPEMVGKWPAEGNGPKCGRVREAVSNDRGMHGKRLKSTDDFRELGRRRDDTGVMGWRRRDF